MTQPKHHSICHNNTRIYNYHIYTYNIYHSIEVLQKTDNDELIVNTYDARCSLVMRVQRPNSLAMLGRMGHFSLVKHCIYYYLHHVRSINHKSVTVLQFCTRAMQIPYIPLAKYSCTYVCNSMQHAANFPLICSR